MNLVCLRRKFLLNRPCAHKGTFTLRHMHENLCELTSQYTNLETSPHTIAHSFCMRWTISSYILSEQKKAHTFDLSEVNLLF